MSFVYDYPRPAVTVDCTVFYKCETGIEVLLIQRKNAPFKDCWAFPGGFVDMEETLEQAALRELAEETGLKNVTLQQFAAYSEPNRDPRGRTISVVFFGFVNEKSSMLKAMDDAKSLNWFSLKSLPKLAFDHDIIMSDLILKLFNNGK